MTSRYPDNSLGGYYNHQFDQFAKGMEYLGGGEANAAVASLGPVVFRPRDMLFIMVRVTSLSTTGIPALRFNDDALANYWDRNLTAAAGGATWAESAVSSATSVRLGGVAAVTGKVGMIVVMNNLASTKNCIGEMTTVTASATVISALQILSGEWVNTTEQIESVTLLNTGTGTFGIDSGFGVFGKDFP